MQDDLAFLATSRQPEARPQVSKHLIGYSTIQFMSETKGQMFLAYDDQTYVLQGPWFWPAHPGPYIQFHPVGAEDTWFHRHVGFTGSLVEKWRAAGLWPSGPQTAPAGTSWEAFFDELITLSRRGDRLGRFQAINRLEHLLLALAEARMATPEDPWLTAILGDLAAAPASPDYEALAARHALSATTFRRRFKRLTGTTPHAYVLQSKLSSARTLLSETDLPLKAIAAELGYNNVHFFARQFREHAGVAPGAYRRSRQR